MGSTPCSVWRVINNIIQAKAFCKQKHDLCTFGLKPTQEERMEERPRPSLFAHPLFEQHLRFPSRPQGARIPISRFPYCRTHHHPPCLNVP